MPTEATRARWYLGNALRDTLRQREAILALRMAWHEFREAHLMVDSALAALDLADALFVNDTPQQIPMICHDVIEQLTNAGLTEHARGALAPARSDPGESVAGVPSRNPREGRACAAGGGAGVCAGAIAGTVTPEA